MIQLSVCGQQISGEYAPAASDSVSYLSAAFLFSPDWNGLWKAAQFTQNGVTYSVALENDMCLVPNELREGKAEISVFGQEPGGVRRITTPAFPIYIRPSGFVPDGETPIPPTPDLYSQLLDQIHLAEEKIPEKVSQLENDAGYVTEKAVPKKLSALENDAGYAKKLEIPTGLSAFQNDAGYAKKEEVPKKVSALENDAGYAKKSELPKKLSALENDERYLRPGEEQIIRIFYDYSTFYQGIAGYYEDTSTWMTGSLVAIRNSKIPLMYVESKSGAGSLPDSEAGFLSALSTTGFVQCDRLTLRAFSEFGTGGGGGSVSNPLQLGPLTISGVDSGMGYNHTGSIDLYGPDSTLSISAYMLSLVGSSMSFNLSYPASGLQVLDPTDSADAASKGYVDRMAFPYAVVSRAEYERMPIKNDKTIYFVEEDA